MVFFAVGCAQVPKEAGFNDVKGLVGQRIDYNLHWNQETEADLEVEKAIEDLLKNELTPETTVQIALLNNPNLQAVYEDLGITQADVVEAGLLERLGLLLAGAGTAVALESVARTLRLLGSGVPADDAVFGAFVLDRRSHEIRALMARATVAPCHIPGRLRHGRAVREEWTTWTRRTPPLLARTHDDAGEFRLLVLPTHPRTGAVVGRKPALELLDLMAHCAWETGDPGILFIDRINRGNPTPELGALETTNPCGEQPLLPEPSRW